MKNHILPALLLCAATLPAAAQVAPPNAAGVSMSHLHYRVADVDANRRFWVALGGTPGEAGAEGQSIVFPGLAVVLTAGQPAGAAEGSVVAHVAFRVKTFAQIEAAGVPVERRRIEGRESGMALAPSGDRVELFEEHAEQVRFRPEAGATTASAERHNRPMTAPIEPHHLHLNVPSGADVTAQRWYVEHFGGVPGIRLRYAAADVPGMNFNFSGVATPTAPTAGRSLDHVAFAVRGLPALVGRLRNAGIAVNESGSPDGRGRRATLVDPWGTGIELVEAQEPPRRNPQGVAFNHVSIEVADFEREAAFWEALGGSRQTPSPSNRFTIVQFPDMNITVREGSGSGGTVGSVINHIGFQVRSTPEAMARFQAAGLRTEAGGFPGQGWLMSPADVRVEILQDPNLALPIRGHHVHFNNAEPLAQQAWYARVFGAVPGKRGNFDAADIAASNTVMNLTFTAVESAPAPTRGRAADHIAFSVDNLAAFLRGLQEQNVTIEQPLTMQANGRTGIAFVADPWGVRIELIDQNAGGGAATAAAAGGRMLRPRIITHVVADLEKSIAFYREGLDLAVASGPGPLTGSALLHKAKATSPAATARQATLTIPGSNLSLQLIQFSGLEGRAFEQRLYDPGVTRFSIQVRDIDKAFDKVKDRGIIVDTTSAGPVFTQRPRNDTRAVMMRDPDGFVFEFVQSGNPVQTDVPETSNIYNARSSLAIEDFDRSFAFYRDILGFTFANPTRDVNDAVLALEGTPRANARSTGGMPPGSNNMWVLWEFRDIARTKRVPNVQDPGASAISLEVENLPALLARMKAAGITVETPGGEAVTIDGRRAALVRSPDGLLVELVEP